MGAFTRDPGHWLYRFAADEWIRAALGELARAEKALGQGDVRAGAVGLKRAAGMALNATLIVQPEPALGRSYMEHLEALAASERVPAAVREACRLLLELKPSSSDVVRLRTPRADHSALEAARDVIAHAWAVVKKHEDASD